MTTRRDATSGSARASRWRVGKRLFLVGVLIEMANRFQPLEQAFDFRFVFGPQQLIPRGRKLAALLSRAGSTSPQNWRYGIPSIKRILCAAAKVTQEALARVDVAGVDEHHPAFAGERELHDQRRHPGSAIETPDFRPGNNAAAKTRWCS